jgi:hypothetical protein
MFIDLILNCSAERNRRYLDAAGRGTAVFGWMSDQLKPLSVD